MHLKVKNPKCYVLCDKQKDLFCIRNRSENQTYITSESLTKPDLTINITSCNFLSEKSKNKLTWIIRYATKIAGPLRTNFYAWAVERKANSITKDSSQPVHHSFQLFPSGWCFRAPLYLFIYLLIFFLILIFLLSYSTQASMSKT